MDEIFTINRRINRTPLRGETNLGLQWYDKIINEGPKRNTTTSDSVEDLSIRVERLKTEN